MKRLRWILAIAIVIAPCVSLQAEPAGQTTFTENFATGSNVGQWTFGAPPWEQIETGGGNPGAFLHNYWLDSFGPMARTGYEASSIFTGNYRARNVHTLGVDFALFHIGYTSVGRPLSLILRNHNGTLDDLYDDCWVYTIGGKQCPKPNGVWHSYSFRVPSKSPTLPDDWGVMNCPGRTEQEAWDLVINEVDEVMFFWADPTMYYIYQIWDVGMDNPTITFGTSDPPMGE